MRRGLAGAIALLLAGCGGEGGFVTMLDHGYVPEVIGTSADGFTAPDGLLWHDGALIMADEGGAAVRVWRPGGPVRTLADAGHGFASPEDLARDQAGNLYVSDDDAGGVRRIASDGTVTTLLGADRLRSSEGIAVAPDGTVLVGDQDEGRILAMSPAGEARELPGTGGIAKPESFAFDDLGNLWIADNKDHVLYLRTPDGRLHRPLGRRRGFSPESIFFAGGALYVTDSRDSVLYRYSLDDGLAPIAHFAGDVGNVQGVTADPAGNLYVSVQADLEGGRGTVLRFNRR